MELRSLSWPTSWLHVCASGYRIRHKSEMEPGELSQYSDKAMGWTTEGWGIYTYSPVLHGVVLS
jgi:hypothetical protein